MTVRMRKTRKEGLGMRERKRGSKGGMRGEDRRKEEKTGKTE